MSRVIGVFQSSEQASALIDDLRNVGLDRKDMIISQMSDDPKDLSVSLKNETDSLTDNETFAEMNGYDAGTGVIVSVEVSAYKRGIVAELMRQRGVTDIRLG